ncbi:hypothetical protein JCM10207_001229 [Rhodosporidiobolus poonsookiae]
MWLAKALLSALHALVLARPLDDPVPLAAHSPVPSAALSNSSSPRILLMRHGEQAPNHAVGLSCVGRKRALCLSKILGPESHHNVSLIVSQSYNKKTAHRKRSYLTVEPLAEAWGLDVSHACYKFDAECAVKTVKDYIAAGGTGDIVMSWKATTIRPIAEGLGVVDPPHYGPNHYDLIWVIQNGKLIAEQPEDCPGIPATPPPRRGPPGGGFPDHPPPWRRPPLEWGGGEGKMEEELEEEEEEECDLEGYLDGQDWSPWIGGGDDVAHGGGAQQVVFAV